MKCGSARFQPADDHQSRVGCRREVLSWEHVGLVLANVHSRFELCVVIYTDVALFLHDIPNDLPPCGGSERVSSLSEDLHQMLCKITASQTKDDVMQSMTTVDGHCVRVRRESRSVLHVIPIRDGPVLNGILNVKTQRLLCASSPTKQRRTAFISRPRLAATGAIMVGACDPRGHTPGFAPR